MDLLDLLKKIYEKSKKLDKIFPDNQFLDDLLEYLEDMIMESYGIPKDNSIEMADKYNRDIVTLKGAEAWEKAFEDKDFFCRDYWSDLLFEFGNGEVSKEKVMEELKNWRVEK